MARSLVTRYSSVGDVVVDPFCGCGVIAAEAAGLARRVVAGDWNPYAFLLTRAKLFPPSTLAAAVDQLRATWTLSRTLLTVQDLRSVPVWVRRFFHPETLRSALAFRDACVRADDYFSLAALLGILHHQRPGFLSYPSSHLVPYLRDKKFPRTEYPTMYLEREVLPRMEAKIQRLFLRPIIYRYERSVLLKDAREFPALAHIQAVITSPPYMNELDYVRDNRLRLWFINRNLPLGIEQPARDRSAMFSQLIQQVGTRLSSGIQAGGYFVWVVGDVARRRSRRASTSRLIRRLFESHSEFSCFRLTAVYRDKIPDIRRSRREYRGTKRETVLVYQKV